MLHSGFITFQSELERMQQSSARSSTTLQSLRQQLTEAEERKQTSSSGLAELQTEIGRLRKELRDKVRSTIQCKIFTEELGCSGHSLFATSTHLIFIPYFRMVC